MKRPDEQTLAPVAIIGGLLILWRGLFKLARRWSA